MSSLPTFEIDRVLTKKEADEVVGEPVTSREPNINDAGVYRDRLTGEAVLLYAPMPGKSTNLRKAVIGTKYGTTLRSSGTRNVSRVFGFTTRSAVLQREACVPTSMAYEDPESQMTLNDTAMALGEYLREILPEVYDNDYRTIGAVLPEWRLEEDALWTSGVINQSSALPYHRDGANFDSWSAMPVLRRGMDGGHLHMPEYDITINCRDGWALWFNGYNYVHGVTPMSARQKDGYRYSIVYYAKRGMKDCHTYAVEIGEARRKRKDREAGMVHDSIETLKEKVKTGRATGGTKIIAN